MEYAVLVMRHLPAGEHARTPDDIRTGEHGTHRRASGNALLAPARAARVPGRAPDPRPNLLRNTHRTPRLPVHDTERESLAVSGAADGCPGEGIPAAPDNRQHGDATMTASIAFPRNTASTFLTHL